MKILLIGYGGVGSILAKLLSAERVVKSIVCGRSHPEADKPYGKLKFVKLDASKSKEVAKLARKADVVINASTPDFNKQILKACVEAKTNYLDLASYWEENKSKNAKYPYTVEQLEFNKIFKKKKIVGLINAGVSPGLTNLIAKEGANQFDSVNSIKIRLVEELQSEELFFPWNVEWALEEYSSRPAIYVNGKYKRLQPFSGQEEYTFPKPIGKKEVYPIAQEEVGTIPLYIKLKNAEIKSYDSSRGIAKHLYKSGLLSEIPIEIGNSKVSPYDILVKVLSKTSGPGRTKDLVKENKIKRALFAFSLEVYGKVKGKNKKINYFVAFPSQKEVNKLFFGANFISYPTALLAKAFVMSIPKIKEKGVFPPENLNKEVRKFILDDLKRNKIHVIKKIFG